MGSSTLNEEIEFRACEVGDMPAIQAIYSEQVLHGQASFEEVPPSLEEMLHRRKAIMALGFPYWVVTVDGEVAGYAYAGRYRPRSAYRHTAEHSVYVNEKYRGRGLGKKLVLMVVASCEAVGIRELIGIVADTEHQVSVRLHEACGFTQVGTIKRVGYKFGQWIDTVIMQRTLSPVNEAILPPLD